MDKISIIVPVYNAEKTLSQTLDSLLGQTYQNIEIVCVDDGSKDNSLDALVHYESDNPSLKVIHQKNQGVSIARNTGINHATGDIVMFVDADDSLVPHTCSRVIEVFNEHKIEVFTFGFKCEPANAIPLGMSKELKPPSRYYPSFKPSLLFSDKARPYACRTAVSKALLDREHIGFEPSIALGEDQIIYFLLYPLANGVILSPEQLYIYNMHNESATHSNANNANGVIKKVDQHMKVIEAILREWKQRGMGELCCSELLEWILDFAMFDINSLPIESKIHYFRRLLDDFKSYYDQNPDLIANKWSTKMCLQDITTALKNMPRTQTLKNYSFVNGMHMAAFYYTRYGLIRCFQQLLIDIGILKKWK